MKKIPNPNKMKRIKGPHLSHKDVAEAKVRITTYLDQDILSILRKMASESGSKYQTVLNQVLRRYLLKEEKGILDRISKLEEAVFQR